MLRVSEIQRFCMHDGPGVRTVIFLKGCPLRCAWCHNPETQEARKQLLFYENKCIMCRACAVCGKSAHTFAGSEHIFDRTLCTACGACAEVCPTEALELCGKDLSPGALLDIIERDAAFYGNTGGVTLSGGEPLLQMDGCIELLRLCRGRNISTAVETCGCFEGAALAELVPLVDLFLWDIKDTDSERHRAHTGSGNEAVLRNLFLADSLHAKIRLRCILVKGVNTDTEHYRRIAAIRNSLSGCTGVEIITYHAYGGSKATFLGGADNGRAEWIPAPEDVSEAESIVNANAPG